MNSFGINSIASDRLEWKTTKGKFATWKVDNFFWHGPIKYNISGKTVSVFKETLFQLPNQKVWYLRGVRQHIWRRCKKIKGFIPLIGMDILSSEITFVIYQDGPAMPNLGFVINSFLKSSSHKKLDQQCL